MLTVTWVRERTRREGMDNYRMHDDHSWVDDALCAGEEPDLLFVQGAAQREVRRRCLKCPVRIQCMADALQCEINFGVWGGLTERERRALLRRFSDVEDWYKWLRTSTEEVAQELRRAQVPRVLALVSGG